LILFEPLQILLLVPAASCFGSSLGTRTRPKLKLILFHFDPLRLVHFFRRKCFLVYYKKVLFGLIDYDGRRCTLIQVVTLVRGTLAHLWSWDQNSFWTCLNAPVWSFYLAKSFCVVNFYFGSRNIMNLSSVFFLLSYEYVSLEARDNRTQIKTFLHRFSKHIYTFENLMTLLLLFMQ